MTDPTATSTRPAGAAAVPTDAQRRSARVQIILLILVFAAPVAMSYVWYFLVHPAAGHTYGTLLDVHPLPEDRLTDQDGKPFSLSSLQGRWLMVAQDVAACDAQCETKLYAMRQVRAALGHDDLRVERVLLLEDSGQPRAALLQQYPGLHVLHLQNGPLRNAFLPAQGNPHAHLWVVDPNGNLVMRYSADPDMPAFLKDMERLLKASQIG